MNWLDKFSEAAIGLSFSGILAAIVWLFKWVAKVDDRLHDHDRDITHIKNTQKSLSEALTQVDREKEGLVIGVRKKFYATDTHLNRIENRLYILEVRVYDSNTHGLTLASGIGTQPQKDLN